jgi:hypothetical protein
MALGGVPGITYNPSNEATIPVVMPLDPLVTVFNWPQTIWRGEMWRMHSGEDKGWVYFHLVFADGTSTRFRKSKPSGNTQGDPGRSGSYVWDLCSDCSNSGPLKTCLKHKTSAPYGMFGAVYRPAGQPEMLFKVRRISYSCNQLCTI